MRRIALGLLIGTACLQRLSVLPDVWWSWFWLLSSLTGLWLVFYVVRNNTSGSMFSFLFSPLRRSSLANAVVVLLSIGVGFFWASLSAHWLLSGELSTELEGQDVVVEGLIASLPESSSPQASLPESEIPKSALPRSRLSRPQDQQQTRFSLFRINSNGTESPSPCPANCY